jgi:hypothetical protein
MASNETWQCVVCFDDFPATTVRPYVFDGISTYCAGCVADRIRLTIGKELESWPPRIESDIIVLDDAIRNELGEEGMEQYNNVPAWRKIPLPQRIFCMHPHLKKRGDLCDTFVGRRQTFVEGAQHSMSIG